MTTTTEHDDEPAEPRCIWCEWTPGDPEHGPTTFPWVARQMPDTCEACCQRAHDEARHRAFGGDPPRGIPLRQRSAVPSDLRADLRRIDFTTGHGAFLYGLPGRGKSYQAAALVQRAWDVLTARTGNPPECRWWRTDIMLNHMRALQGKPEYVAWYNDILNCHVLVLDDFGAERVTEWAREQLLLILSERYDQHRCTIITSNFSLGELARRISEGDARYADQRTTTDPSGERIASRIAEVCVRVHIDGPDRRLNPELNNGGHDA